MPQTIIQKIIFKNTDPKILYDLYMDSKKHSAATGAPAKISAKVGGSFSAHRDYIKGKNIHLITDKTIVQTWRALDWNEKDEDSVFIINFETKGKDTILHVFHINVPDKHTENLDKGWHDYYWNPWKQYLEEVMNHE